jgi:hypothetical protein
MRLVLFWGFLDHHHEISGSKARKALLGIRDIMSNTNEIHEQPDGRRLYRLIVNLSHIQDLAYANDSRRNKRNILALYGLTYLFRLDFKKVNFNNIHM